jgi:hypothetical protein
LISYSLEESSKVLIVVRALALHAFFLALGVGLFGQSSTKCPFFLPQVHNQSIHSFFALMFFGW